MPKVLLVDDHPELADVIRQLLEIHGHDVEIVGDAESAVQRLQSEQYAALITDDRLPGKSGIGGGIVAVSPGKGGFGTFAPPLDAAGNSVKGQLAAKFLSQRLGMDLFVSQPAV